MDKKLILVFVLFLALASGCNRKAYQAIESNNQTYVKDSVRIVYQDRILKVPIPQDSVRVDTLPKVVTIKDTPQIKDLFINRVNGIVGVSAWIKRGRLGALGYVRDSSIYYRADSLQKEIYRLRLEKKVEVKTEKEVIIKKKIPTIGWIGILFFFSGIVYLVIKIKMSVTNRKLRF